LFGKKKKKKKTEKKNRKGAGDQNKETSPDDLHPRKRGSVAGKGPAKSQEEKSQAEHVGQQDKGITKPIKK